MTDAPTHAEWRWRGCRSPHRIGYRALAVLCAGLLLSIGGMVVLQPTRAAAATCDTSWTGGNADWTNAAHWTAGVPTSSSNACLPAGSDTVTITGESVQAKTLSVGSGVTLTLQITGCGPVNAVLTLSGNMTNAGTLNLSNLGDACGGTAQVVIPSGSTLTNTGTIATTGCCRGDREIIGSVTNQGTINVNFDAYCCISDTGFLHLDGSGSLFDNQGALNIQSGMKVDVPSGTGMEFRNDTGGSITANNGGETNPQFIMDAGNTFTEGAGTTSGNDVLVNGGSTLHFTGSGASTFDLRGDGGGNTISGSTIAAGQTLNLQIHGCGVVSSVATLTSSMTNSGTINLSNVDDGCGGTAQLIIPTGKTLTNTGTIATTGCCRGDRELTGSVTNQGNVNVNFDAYCCISDTGFLHLDGSGSLFDNQGAVTIQSGMKVDVPSGTGMEFRNDTGGSVTANNGSETNPQFMVDSGNTFTEGAGTTSGNPILHTGGTTLHFTGAGASSFDLRGDGGANTISGSTIAAGQTVTLNIHGCGPVSSIANLSGSMTNAGTINLGNADDGCGGTDQIVVPSGSTLTNTGTIATIGCCRGARELTGSITDQGTVNVNSIGGSGGTLQIDPGVFAVSGTLNVAAGMTLLNVDDTLIVEPGGTFTLTGSGIYTQQSGATLGVTVDAVHSTFTGISGGTTNLAGTLQVTTLGLPAAGSTWPIISGISRSGSFGNCGFGSTCTFGNAKYTVLGPPTGVTLVAQAATTAATTPSTSSGTITTLSGGGVSQGTIVYDAASITGNSSTQSPTGSVDFYICTPATLTANSATTCDKSIGTLFATQALPAGSGASVKTFSTGQAVSSVGTWCFAGYYAGDSTFPAASDTSTDECFTVVALAPSQTKVTPTFTG